MRGGGEGSEGCEAEWSGVCVRVRGEGEACEGCEGEWSGDWVSMCRIVLKVLLYICVII